MGNTLFDVDIAGIIADTFEGQLLDATVTRYTLGDRNPQQLSAGRSRVPTAYPGITGYWEDYTGNPPPGVTIELGDRKAVLIGDTIPAGGVPERNDSITMEGQTLWVVQLQSRDPAGAVYVFQCRDRGPLPDA